MSLAAPVAIGPAHRLDAFDCGTASLNEWLRRRAWRNDREGASRTYVAADATMRVVGYYALASGALALAHAPGGVRRNMPDPVPVAVLGRLAVDVAWRGKGLGAALLRDAALRARKAAAILGVRGLIVHALDDDGARFFQRFGFIEAVGQRLTLILSLRDG